MDKIISESQKQEWRKKYLSNRYLAHLSVPELENRLDDILLNLLIFSKDGLPLFDNSIQMSGIVERFIHLDEEMCQRSIYINLVNKAKEYKEKYPNILKAINAWNDRKPIAGEYLVVFGPKIYLEQIKRMGKMRIKPAFSYNDPSLNEAVRDDELLQTIILPQGTKLKRKISSGEYEKIEGIKKILISHRYSSDFYVYCMSSTFQPCLFDDFKADACLLIFDVQKYLNKFLNFLKTNYSNWLVKSEDVRYYDPFFPTKLLDIPFNKHFRFWYQSEFRIAFKPRTPIRKLEVIYPEIGSLDECCELMTI